jgi:hypothetical protein
MLSRIKKYSPTPNVNAGVRRGVSVENTLASIKVDACILTRKIKDESTSGKYYILIDRKIDRNILTDRKIDRNKTEKVLFKVSEIALTNLKNSMSIEQVIEEVSTKIK